MVLPVGILDRSAIESSNELNTSDGTFPGTMTAQLFCEDRVVEDSNIPKLGILVKCIEALPVVDEVVLHGDHVELVEAGLVVDVANAVVVQCQSLQIFKMAEFNDFIPRFDVVAFQVDKLEEAELLSRHWIHAANLVTVIAHKMKLLNVGEDRCECQDLRPVKIHFNENHLAQASMNQLSHILSFEVVRFHAVELIPCQRDSSQIGKLMDDLKVLVPRVKFVLVEVEIHRSRNQLAENARLTNIRDAHIVEGYVPAVCDISAPIVSLIEADHLDFHGLALSRRYKLLRFLLLPFKLLFLLSHQVVRLVPPHNCLFHSDAADINLSVADE